MRLALISLAVLLSKAMAYAIPQLINYQGQLTSTSGSPLDTTVAMTFTIYDAVAGGTNLWTETHPSVTVAAGLFYVQLGSVTALADLFSANRWLGVTVGNNTEMTRRTQMVSVAHAYRVGTVDGASGGTITSDLIVNNRINVGTGNTNTGSFANVLGENNVASGDYSTVSGGGVDTASGTYASVSGGYTNTALGTYASVSGGNSNTASGGYAAISGGSDNTASGQFATVSGGNSNTASTSHAAVSGGYDNTASGQFATVSGGYGNSAWGIYATVSGGDSNTTLNSWCTVSGGDGNTASGNSATVSGGDFNTASGAGGTVSGGYQNSAAGDYSLAGGCKARANDNGAFVWGSSTSSTDSTASFNSYTFTARCANGARFYTAQTGVATGVSLPAGGGAWAALCDVNQKHLLGGVNTSEVLQKLASLPLHRWSYKSQSDAIQHIGPTAQDFYATFGLGDNNTTISTLDPDGIALAAIQELAKEVRDLRLENQRQQLQIQSLLAGKQPSARLESKEK
jgi:hypothetical protein